MVATHVKARITPDMGTPHEGNVVDARSLKARAREVLSKYEGRTYEDKIKAFEKARELASLGGVADLNAIEGDYYILNLYRDSIALDFVEMRDLPLGTIPIYRTRYENPVQVHQGSLAGHGMTSYYATSDTAVQVSTFTLETDEVMVPNLNNIYNMEQLGQRVAGRKRLADYMDMGINNVCLNQLLQVPGSPTDLIATDPAAQIVTYFNSGGSFSGQNVYILDPGVQSAAVPSLNVYDLSAQGGITKQTLMTLNTHRAQLGMRIRKIYIPTAGAPWQAWEQQASIVALASGQGNQNPQNAITPVQWEQAKDLDPSTDFSIQWGGQDFIFSKQNWLPQGYCLALLDMPGVIMWNRLKLSTGETAEGTLETPVNAYYNRMSVANNFGVARPGFCLKAFVVFKCM